MNKLKITFCASFFLIEAIIISIFLLDVTMNIDKIVPWVIGGAVNFAFLFVLLSGMFDKK